MLINRLLDWARMESGRRSYTLRRTRIDAVVDGALQAFEPQTLAGNVQVSRSVEPGLPEVMADPQALVEAILNLLNNAHKYTGPDKQIAVAARKEGGAVLVSVTDNGPGIQRRDQKRIFDKFYRAQDPLAREIEGTGLGLAMVKHIVGAHGGHVEVDSDIGKGARFTIFLPIAEKP
jgi:two-component system phosphate regulon sensor histidine kinase PhoR